MCALDQPQDPSSALTEQPSSGGCCWPPIGRLLYRLSLRVGRDRYRTVWPCCAGDYDLEVLLQALQRRRFGLGGYWPVAHEEAVTAFCAELAEPADGPIQGLLVNRPSNVGCGRHWYCLVPSTDDASHRAEGGSSGSGGAAPEPPQLGDWLCQDSGQPAASRLAAGADAA
eukprot:CAMPEP_0183592766 /NCGR_PEP_ID=MMETSP0371-20130417/168590_1 /TAXON_ID=268820 /ORGANISM="Peridinium aciculiferum, Strain PAER-2" /LENGTH=169 /DNA_ID=CAMNT_0025804323 /DNA_START=30 /DNA_END=535 /DNA_ORIENTATION=+